MMNFMNIRSLEKQKNVWKKRTLLPLVCFLVCLVSFNVPFAFANVLGNGDFSQPLGSGTDGNWDNTQGATRVQFGTPGYPAGFSAPPNGQYGLRLDGNSGAFTFQTKDNVKPGALVTFSAMAMSDVDNTKAAHQMKIEFKKINPDGSDTTILTVPNPAPCTPTTCVNNLSAAGGFKPFQVSAIAPEGTGRVAFVFHRLWGPGGPAIGQTVFADANAEVNPAKLSVSASKRNVKKGDAIGINAHFNNASGNTFANSNMRIKLPNGFDHAQDSIRVNGQKVAGQEGSLIIPLGTITPGETYDVTFATLVTSGVQLGKTYSLEVTVEGGGGALSETARVQFTVQGDPIFDEGTIIGKVFNDLNQDGVQQCGEQGVPWVTLYTEEGIKIVTDEFGRYHIPGVSPGRHLVKIDGHTLPEGTKFVTEETYLVKITPGIMGKANFAVLLPPSGIPETFRDDLMVMITQGADISRPNLDIAMEPSVLKLGVGLLEKEPLFKFDSNYAGFAKKWTLEIRDEMGTPVWKGFGVGQPPPEMTWNGKTENGLMIKPGIYSYQLKIRDSKNREDWTPLKFFEVYNKLDERTKKNYQTEIPSVGDFNLFKDGKRSIPLIAKPTVRIQGKTKPDYEIKINEIPVSVDPETGMFQKEFYVEPGEREFTISATSAEGESTSYQEKVQVKDSTFFMVALGEEQLGVNFSKGAMEAADTDAYRDGFTEEGRFSYYLKAKLKGKFLIKSHYDTSDRRSALFTNLDPDEYYPIYGDGSSRDYEAQDTAQRLFVLVEMDKSFLKWGSFKTGFTDTELASYNRTLSGLQISFDTVASTVYGDPKRGFKLFWTESGKQADHNEFYATGGSLYYTRQRNIVEGSEKIRVEVRDKITGMVLSSYDMTEGADYEISYGEGRILLSRPLSSVAATDTLVTADIMDGNPVYLIVDYEYEPSSSDLPEISNRGIRGYTWAGDHVRVGATAVEEKRAGGQDYDLRGVDMMLKFGRNTQITAEYATSINKQMDSSVSYDGGISFGTEGNLRGNNTRPRENAYVIRGQSQPVRNLEVSGYVQGVEPGFSNGHMTSQEGFKKYGIATRYKFTDTFSARYRFDSSEVIGQLLPLAEHNIAAPYEGLQVHTAQLVYDDGKYLAQAEYQRSNIDHVENSANLVPSLYSEVPFEHGIATKIGYHINDRLLPYVKAQTTLHSADDYQVGGGIRCELIKNVFGYIEQMFGPLGDSTHYGFEKQHDNGARSYASLRSVDRGIGSRTLSTAIGSSFPLTEKSRMYSEREHTSYQGVDGFADILGYEGSLGDHWDFGAKYERRHLDSSMARAIVDVVMNGQAVNNSTNVVAGHVGYADGKKIRARTYAELRMNGGYPQGNQLVLRNSLQYQINRDLAFLTKFDYGATYLFDLVDNNKQMNLGNFADFSVAFAYRPVGLDHLNFLLKYSYLRDIGNDMQFMNGYYNDHMFHEIAHIVALDAAYDFNRYFGFVQKLAWKRSTLITQNRDVWSLARNTLDETDVNNFLTVSRINFHVTRKWDVAAEYRLLWQSSAMDTMRHGMLFEVDREIYDYVRLGVGYNFTDFSDDLRHSNDYQNSGPFVRMTGKF